MDPAAFRRDPWLRTSGYHLATWSLVAFVLELWRDRPGEVGAAQAVALVGGAFLTSLTHERRVAKMAGIAGEPVYSETALVWRLVFVGLAASMAAMLAAPNMAALFPVAMCVLGIGFAQWGAGAGFPRFVWLGAFMVAAALLDVSLGAAGSRLIRQLVLGFALPAFGVATSRRYLWFRLREDGESGSRTA